MLKGTKGFAREAVEVRLGSRKLALPNCVTDCNGR